MTDFTGQTFDGYRMLESLGRGGMAEVYQAYDTRSKWYVAVKVIRTDMIVPAALPEVLQRFEREAKTLVQLNHPNIVSITDSGTYAGVPYLVMEYFSGGSLKDRLHGQPLPWQEAVRLLLPIGRALEFAHAQGVLHGGVKPSNILITSSDEAMLSDFGIGWILGSAGSTALRGSGDDAGAPEYMAPEQWTGKTSAQSDLYALGVVLYEMLTGRKPYTGETPAEILLKQANQPVPRPKQFVPDLPERLEKVLLKALAKQPEERYQGMGEFLEALEGLLSAEVKIKPPVVRQKKQESQGSIKPEYAELPELKQIGDQAAGAAWLTMPEELLPQAIKADKARNGSPERPLREGLRRNRKIIHPVWIIALVGLAVVIAFAAWGIPRLAATSIPITTATLRPTLAPTLVPSLSPTITFTPTAVPWTRPADGMVMVDVPAGNFSMGDNDGPSDGQPVHTVYLNAYWIDKTAVTNTMYALCVKSGDCPLPSQASSMTRTYYYDDSLYADYPVIYVNWTDANAYCSWAGARLPTEAEWEKAARGSDGRDYPWGNVPPTCSLANFGGTIGGNSGEGGGCPGDTSAVGAHPAGASPYGALDMAGDVREWVNDWYDASYYANSPASNPQGPSSGAFRILRGGSWFDFENVIRSADRNSVVPNYTDRYVGFRCARSATSSTPTLALVPSPTLTTTSNSPTGTVTGSIWWDNQPFASVVVKLCTKWLYTCTGTEFSGITDSSGSFTISGISPGDYQVITKYPGQNDETRLTATSSTTLSGQGGLPIVVKVSAGQMLNVNQLDICKVDLVVFAPKIQGNSVTISWKAYPGADYYYASMIGQNTTSTSFTKTLAPGNYQEVIFAGGTACAEGIVNFTVP